MKSEASKLWNDILKFAETYASFEAGVGYDSSAEEKHKLKMLKRSLAELQEEFAKQTGSVPVCKALLKEFDYLSPPIAIDPNSWKMAEHHQLKKVINNE